MKKFICSLLSVLTLLLAPALSYSKQERPSSTGDLAGVENISKRFFEMGTPKTPLILNTWQASYVVKVPISPREKITDAMLFLDTTNSTALIKSRSELRIRLNGEILQQHPLDPVNTKKQIKVRLPRDLLKVGFNDLEIGVVQHYTYDCEDPSSPELWTEINPINSYISVNYAGLFDNPTPKMTQLGTAFDSRFWNKQLLYVVVGTSSFSDIQTAAAATAVQGLFLRKNYAPLDIKVLTFNQAGALVKDESSNLKGLNLNATEKGDLLLIGKKSDLSVYLSSQEASKITGPFVGMLPVNNGKQVALIVSGTSDSELMNAARSVGDPEFKYSNSSFNVLDKNYPFKRVPALKPRVPSYFSDYSFSTQSSRGVKVQPIEVQFKAPADYGAKKGDLAKLLLHFSYGAGLRPDSSLVIKLNGNFAASVSLNEKDGGEFLKYEVAVPAQFIKPGYNSLVFEPIFMGHKDRCDMFRDEHMVLTVYEDSTLELPVASVAPKVPDLERFSQGLWPYQEEIRAYLTSAEASTVEAFLKLVGVMAKKARDPFDIQVSYYPFSQGHMLVVGEYGELNDFVKEALPLKEYSWSAQNSQVAWIQVKESNRVITAYVGEYSEALSKGVELMVDQGYFNGLKGAASLIDTKEIYIKTEPAKNPEDFTATDTLSSSFYSWKWIVVLVIVFVSVFVVALNSLSKRISKQRTGETE